MEFFGKLLEEFKKIEEKISEEVRNEFKNCKYDELSQYHFSIGLYIRNNILFKKGKIYSGLEKIGYSYDEMSVFLIKLLYLYLNG